ncbi:MAG: glycosyltransferase family 2 protein [Ilumatobacteraceae bacterium]|nr:glycosyltransferase family 2 protein [Ilumatobacteraceae bacterium]
METQTQSAPPVVAVVVVHHPAPEFDQVLDAFAAQDYPNLRLLFLVTASESSEDDAALAEQITARLPEAFVRTTGANPGFAATANEVLRLVEGDNGFLLICHDDVAPDPDAVRTLVEELFRSNAGVVGPKLVDWDDPRVLRSVGLGADRFGHIDAGIEPGEVDQEQHDGVRDVFVVPSACMLVRADLFRALGGFDAAITYYGEDLEFCWRAHFSGARVIVAPVARVRHAGRLSERRADLRAANLEARHRVRTVATLTGPARVVGRSLELVLLTVVELVVGLFTGRLGEAWASLRAVIGLIPRTPAILSRRRTVREVRRVPEREISGLQVRGSVRLSAYLRTRETTTFVGADRQIRRWRDSTTAPVIAWIAVLIGLFIGARDFFTDGVPPVGEFLAFPESPRRLLDTFRSGWNPTGVGATSSNPTGWATLSLASVGTLFRMGLLQTLFTVGTVLVGAIGMWKLATVFPSTRARLAALIVYAATPIVSGAMHGGQLTVLVMYASTPWILHLLRRAAGIETADPTMASDDVPDGIVKLDRADRVRRTAAAVLVVALGAAFAPIVLVVAAMLGVLLAVGTLLALASWRTAVHTLAITGVTVVGAALLNAPWVATWSWSTMVGPPPVGEAGLGLVRIASFDIGATDFAVLALALYLPVIAAIALARAWRLTWAVRAGTIIIGFGGLAVLADRGSLPFDMPAAGVLLAPVAAGVAIAAGAALAAFDLDVRGGSFGWRQPLGLLASAAVAVGVLPGVFALGDGSWDAPTTPLSSVLDARLPSADEDGAYNTLLVGDARLLPVPGTQYRDGISWAVIDDGPLDVTDRWAPPSTDASAAIDDALDQIAASSTLRAGQLLAPLGIRFIVVPVFDGVASTLDDPLPVPAGLVESLDDQLDLVTELALPTLELFENRAWIPTRSLLTGATAEASESAGSEALVRADLSESSPVFVDADQLAAASETIQAGVVHLGTPFADAWTLTVDGADVPARRDFGLTTAFDVSTAGEATLEYQSSATRSLLVALQVVLWLLAIVLVVRVSVSLSARTTGLIDDETLIDLDDAEPATLDPGLDITGQIARQDDDVPAETGQ